MKNKSDILKLNVEKSMILDNLDSRQKRCKKIHNRFENQVFASWVTFPKMWSILVKSSPDYQEMFLDENFQFLPA